MIGFVLYQMCVTANVITDVIMTKDMLYQIFVTSNVMTKDMIYHILAQTPILTGFTKLLLSLEESTLNILTKLEQDGKKC